MSRRFFETYGILNQGVRSQIYNEIKGRPRDQKFDDIPIHGLAQPTPVQPLAGGGGTALTDDMRVRHLARQAMSEGSIRESLNKVRERCFWSHPKELFLEPKEIIQAIYFSVIEHLESKEGLSTVERREQVEEIIAAELISQLSTEESTFLAFREALLTAAGVGGNPNTDLDNLNNLRQALDLDDAVGTPPPLGGVHNIPTEAEIAETVKAYAELPVERRGKARWKPISLAEALDAVNAVNPLVGDRPKIEDYHQMLQDPKNSFYNEIYKLTPARLVQLRVQHNALGGAILAIGAFVNPGAPTIAEKENLAKALAQLPDGVAAGSFHAVVTAAGGAALNGWGLRAINYHQLNSNLKKPFSNNSITVPNASFAQIDVNIRAGLAAGVPPALPGVVGGGPAVPPGPMRAALLVALQPLPVLNPLAPPLNPDAVLLLHIIVLDSN